MPFVLPLTAMPRGLGDQPGQQRVQTACNSRGTGSPPGEDGRRDPRSERAAQGRAHPHVTPAQDGPAAAQKARGPGTGALATAGEQPARWELTAWWATEAEHSAPQRVMPTQSLHS